MGGTASLNIKSGKNSVAVPDAAVKVSVVVDMGEGDEDDVACTFWDGEGPSTKGCEVSSVKDGILVCDCTHLTDFMGTLTTPISKPFKNANLA